ncbi:hypothetical protein NTHI1209_01751 [Haemophilus influenzae]|uniref:Uncharacterized protein n=1 Tax=Haemophilus influenzae TaxID=727 RepID=A0A158SZ17_HAEIF|nr:hypothetical protein NTHI1209_01751 [Haemophilus influenzae]
MLSRHIFIFRISFFREKCSIYQSYTDFNSLPIFSNNF